MDQNKTFAVLRMKTATETFQPETSLFPQIFFPPLIKAQIALKK